MKTAKIVRGCTCALALALAGCAKDPTELYITVSLDGTLARPITSLMVTIDAAAGQTSRPFASLAAVPADASLYVAPFAFPTFLDYTIARDATAISGEVTVTVEGRDPFTDDTLLAHGVAMATVAPGKTTTTAVTLTPDALPVTAPDGGVPDGGADDGSTPDAAPNSP
jgi:hypothetical protein